MPLLLPPLMNNFFAEHPSWDEMWAHVLGAQGPERARALTHLAMHLYQRDDNQEAIALLDEAFDLLKPVGLHREAASCAHDAGVAAAELRRLDEAVAYHMKAAASLHAALREAEAARCLVHAAELEMGRQRALSAAKLFREAAVVFDRSEAYAEAAQAWTAAGEAYRASGSASAQKCFGHGEARWKRAHQPVEAAKCMVAIGWLQLDDAKSAAAEATFRRARLVLAAVDDDAADDARTGLAVAIQDRDPAAAYALLAEVLESSTERGNISRIGLCQRWLGRVEATLGDPDAALDRLEEAEALLDAAGVVEAVAEVIAERAQLLTALGQHSEALVCAERAMTELPRAARAAVRAFCTISFVGPLKALGRTSEAENAARKAASLYKRGGLPNRRIAAEQLAAELGRHASDGRFTVVPA